VSSVQKRRKGKEPHLIDLGEDLCSLLVASLRIDLWKRIESDSGEKKQDALCWLRTIFS
jgi:hypothetical protein